MTFVVAVNDEVILPTEFSTSRWRKKV